MNDTEKSRYMIRLCGVVQGVGYRPYIFQKAKEYGICGWVNNAGAMVIIDAEGERNSLKCFVRDVAARPPVLADIKKVEIRLQASAGYEDFEIRESDTFSKGLKLVSPDVGACEKCMSEVRDPHSRRYRYAFTNCTECGPRFSIIKALPYDRCNTTMKDFQQCSCCETEYNNPESRRFHTQPNCCSDCGPSLELAHSHGCTINCTDPIGRTIELIKKGNIIAIKGIGGFHLCCDASNDEAVMKLRNRKKRPHKPLAVMTKNIQIAARYCEISSQELKLLSSPRRPIVLLKKKEKAIMGENIAPCLKSIGLMLPYLPLQHLLFDDGLEMLVMTSGNRSRDPIQCENDSVIQGLDGIADYFLLHNRDIYSSTDDSVVKLAAGREQVSRRARGYIPYALDLGINHDILALGAEQKNSVCLSQSGYAYMSQYIGDLKEMAVYERFKEIIDKQTALLKANPLIYVHDLHPQYLSTWHAEKQTGPKIPVQHHHAHMVSCMAEHKLFGEVIGIIFDGTGLGYDGSIWGGEFFIGSRKCFRRVGHLGQVLLQGGDRVVQEPWRSAACYLRALGLEARDYIKTVERYEMDAVLHALASGLNCHSSTSMGRLFDCIAALIGVRDRITYDAQAAIELEDMAEAGITSCYGYRINTNSEPWELDYRDILAGVLADLDCRVPASAISAKFHNTIAAAAADMVLRLREIHKVNDVVLSGGVFENRYLLEDLHRRLKDSGFSVFFNEQIPINDSGISVGQLVIADSILED